MVTNDRGNTGSGGPLSDTDVVPIEVLPVNDAPVNQLPCSMTVKEDGSLSLSGISVQDVDAGSAPMAMVLRVEHGVLTLLGAAGAVSVQGTGSNEMTWWDRWPTSTSCWPATCTMNRRGFLG